MTLQYFYMTFIDKQQISISIFNTALKMSSFLRGHHVFHLFDFFFRFDRKKLAQSEFDHVAMTFQGKKIHLLLTLT